jgi:hypothetical protein
MKSEAVNEEGYVVDAFWSSKEAEFSECHAERLAGAVTGPNSNALS